jgi:tetratricopeptide (TPR) repeat protein
MHEMKKTIATLSISLIVAAASAEEMLWDRLQQAKSTESALELCDAELQRKPSDIYAYFYRAKIKRETGSLAGALEDLNRAIELEPSFSDAYALRAYVKKHQGDEKGFKADLARSRTVDHILDGLSERIQKDKGDAKAYLERAQHKKYSNPPDIHGAIEDFEAYLALQDEKRNQMPYIYLAGCYKRVGLDGNAIKTLSRGIDDFPNFDEFYQRRMELRKEIGDLQGAEEDRKKLASFANRKSSKRIDSLSEHITTASAQPGAHLAGLLAMRAEAFLDVGDIESAQEDVNRAMEIDPNNRMARNALKKLKRQKTSNN